MRNTYEATKADLVQRLQQGKLEVLDIDQAPARFQSEDIQCYLCRNIVEGKAKVLHTVDEICGERSDAYFPVGLECYRSIRFRKYTP